MTTTSHLPDLPIMKYVHPTDRLRPWFGVALGLAALLSMRIGFGRGNARGDELPFGWRLAPHTLTSENSVHEKFGEFTFHALR
jgi:hypothetical protein